MRHIVGFILLKSSNFIVFSFYHILAEKANIYSKNTFDFPLTNKCSCLIIYV